MTLKEIVLAYLKQNEFDGLWCDDCCCSVDDLMPCEGMWNNGPKSTCKSGHKIPCPDPDECECEGKLPHIGECK